MTRKEKIAIALGFLQGSLVCGTTTCILTSVGLDFVWALTLGHVAVLLVALPTYNIHDRLAEMLS